MMEPQDTRFDELIRTFLAARVFALVGASSKPEKYGNIILRNLVSKGYRVVPVNPSEKEIEGITCSPDIESLPDFVKFINVVIPPQRSLAIIASAVKKGVRIAWFQPGSYDEAVVAECEKQGLDAIYGPCIMVCAAQSC